MLYLVATPIGNMGDITFRAVEILKSADYILCEDTRHSLPLLKRYEIQKPLKSLHKFNEASREAEVVQDLQAGLNVALISDAGTPGIADPGSRLVQRCLQEDLLVTSIPGPCAAIAALTASGLDSERFQFIGFLPRRSGELTALFKELLSYRGTSICYESPHRLSDTLKILAELNPNQYLVVARELTKKFEEFLRGSAAELLAKVEKSPLKGEIILLFPACETVQDWSAISPEQHVQQLEEELHLSRQEAIKAVAKLRGVPKRTIYNAVMR